MDAFWTSLFTLVAGLGGAFIAGYFTSRSEWRRLRAEAAREARQVERDDAAAAAAAESQRAAESKKTLSKIRDLFLAEITTLRSKSEFDARDFQDVYYQKFLTTDDIYLRRAIGEVLDDQQRGQLMEVVEAIELTVPISTFHSRNPFVWADRMFTMGSELAATFARGQAPDTRLERVFKTMQDQVRSFEVDKEKKRSARLAKGRAIVGKLMDEHGSEPLPRT